jgi:hypothetical protein
MPPRTRRSPAAREARREHGAVAVGREWRRELDPLRARALLVGVEIAGPALASIENVSVTIQRQLPNTR